MNKPTIFLIFFGLILIKSSAQTGVTVAEKSARILFEHKSYDSCSFHTKDKAEWVQPVRFKNTGNSPLIINNVITSTGADVAEWPKDPILRGRWGVIKYTYLGIGRPGHWQHCMYVQSNASKDRTEVCFSGNVVDDAGLQSAPVGK